MYEAIQKFTNIPEWWRHVHNLYLKVKIKIPFGQIASFFLLILHADINFVCVCILQYIYSYDAAYKRFAKSSAKGSSIIQAYYSKFR